MRIDLGLIQLETTGRPDGERPEGHESLLEYFESKAQEAAEGGVCLLALTRRLLAPHA